MTEWLIWGRKIQRLELTSDKNIRSREDSLRLQDGDEGRLLLDKEYRLLEIKVAGAFPIEIARILSELEIYPVSFSKYGNIYKSKMKDCAAGIACQSQQENDYMYEYSMA